MISHEVGRKTSRLAGRLAGWMPHHPLAGPNPLFSSRIRPGRRGRAESIFGSPAPAARGTHISHGASLARTHARAENIFSSPALAGRGTSQLAGWLPPPTPWPNEIHCFHRELSGATSRAGEDLQFARPSRQRNIVSRAHTAYALASWLAATPPPGAEKSIVFFED